MNDNAELYQKNNSLQRRDAVQCLEKYSGKIKWKNYGDRIIDIGCGDGGVMKTIKNYIPIDYKQLVGCDISEKMIHYANKNHADERTKFMVLDIEQKLPEKLKENFDHAFSFYALHWIKNQETGFRNIYDLLNENGDCLLAFLGNMPLFDVYNVLAKNNKWSTWLRDVERYISPYHKSQDPEKEVTKLLEKVGFNDIYVKCEDKQFIYDDLHTCKKAIEAVNPFNIPRDLFDDFMLDLLQVIINMRLIDIKNNNVQDKCKVVFTYKLIIVYANKKGLGK